MLARFARGAEGFPWYTPTDVLVGEADAAVSPPRGRRKSRPGPKQLRVRVSAGGRPPADVGWQLEVEASSEVIGVESGTETGPSELDAPADRCCETPERSRPEGRFEAGDRSA